MKSISPNPFVPQVMREWKPLRHFWHTPMERSVETRCLRQSWKPRRHCIDALYGAWQVKRSKRNKLAEFSHQRSTHPFCRPMAGAAVDDPMTGGSRVGQAQILYRFG